MLISQEYIAQNKQLHDEKPSYGTSSAAWGLTVKGLARKLECASVLDYGCGKGLLGKAIGEFFDWREYDPAIEGKDGDPVPADMVVCTDVMEHIEPECLESVLDHIQKLAGKVVFLHIATRPAKKTLADGRNAHLIVEGMDWWLPKLMGRWHMAMVKGEPDSFLFVGVAR